MAAESSSEPGVTPDDDQPPAQDLDFVTLGMFIIDEIEYTPPKPPQKDVLGGAGSYAALGARLFSPGPLQSKTVGWIVDQGSDFPPAITTLIDSWETTALVRHDPDRRTTRGWNGYVDDYETRAFKYTTPKKRLVASDLSGSPLLQSRSFHIICSPSRCRELVTELLTLRKDEAPPEEDGGRGGYSRPAIIWEPVPDLCTPDELLNLTNCLPLVDVCSPNHSELAGFMGDSGIDPETGDISTLAVEQACEQLLGSMPLSSFTLVVRAGEKGCYIAKNGGRKNSKKSGSKQRKKVHAAHGGLQPDTDMMSLFAGLLQQSAPDEDGGDDDGAATFSFIQDELDEVEIDPGLDKWIPAFFTKDDAAAGRVVDPTGGGNTFLGALAVALARGRTMEEAACWGSIAASFAIEQVGVPELGRDDDGEETWNGDRVQDRLEALQARLEVPAE
ncbi:putative mak32 protein [Diaporthe ampelina]|uniref:Putative mak32 protein n=1 Tax=Diaporthe ampelina TaxID=1214573 RepID=A0A0G2FRV9_9PEZI|nr:putative mak32 protein [Diaporthe ampelina]